jgi:CO/xanthine dehydrogenase FAD-binding subunit
VYLRAQNLAQALEAIRQIGAQVLAGGTDFYPALGDRIPQHPIVDITMLSELKGISREPDHFRIGGLTTWKEVVSSPLPRCFDALKAAAREIGGVQIQNRGTVAGNLCNASPAADSVPPLLILNAEVELVSDRGIRRIPLAEFITGNRRTLRQPDELVTAVLVPRDLEEAPSSFLKLGARRYLVISIAMVAVLISIENKRVRDARIAVGSCSARAQRLTILEAAFSDAPVAEGLRHLVTPEHLATLTPIDDVRATAVYRADAALTLVRRALAFCLEGN